MIAILFVSSYTLMAQKELYRPNFHFTPAAHWMNDPNGLYYNNGVYNLFFQYYPNDTKWGPMHWGHATSSDLISWKQQPIALYPDSLGYIFSGSVVIDKNNTSGLGKNGHIPVVAIFTHHDPKGEAEKRNNYQYQSIAYSLDDGNTWTKYSNNPVLPNPGITDFRDPKVSWNEASKKWIMALAVKDRISFYSSSNLLQWSKESEFGEKLGGHGGVWECPDLFPLSLNGKKYWVLLVSINPGGPNGGSATQYFIGDWNGKTFYSLDDKTRWIDYGPDNYAGVTYGNITGRTVFMGWMSNWNYGQQVPTAAWRSAMTIPRELSLAQTGKEIMLRSTPAGELKKIEGKSVTQTNLQVKKEMVVESIAAGASNNFKLQLTTAAKDFSIVLSNDKKEELVLGYESKMNRYYINRSKAGVTQFGEGFDKIAYAPATVATGNLPTRSITLYVDDASIEMFADGGVTNMTGIFFFNEPYNKISLRGDNLSVSKMTYTILNPAKLTR